MSNLRILHWNSNGIEKKINELQAFSSTQNVDIILLSETRISSTANLKIPNFIMYKTDLPPKRSSPHGGTAILVRRNIIHLPFKLNTHLQSTSIQIKLNNTEMLIISVYKPSNPKFKNKLNLPDHIITEIREKNKLHRAC